MLTLIASVHYNLQNVVGDRGTIGIHFALYLKYIRLFCGRVNAKNDYILVFFVLSLTFECQ